MYAVIHGQNVNLGDAYGYCYHPEVMTQQGTITSITNLNNDIHTENHPYLDTAEEAINWLVARGVNGQIMRYAHHLNQQERDRQKQAHAEDPLNNKPYYPWYTSGVVATITNLKDHDLTTVPPALAVAMSS